MAKQNRNTLKSYFETGKRPTEGQYVDLIDSAIIFGEPIDTDLVLQQNILIEGIATFGTSTVTINGTAGHITASGNISASGTIFSNAISVGTVDTGQGTTEVHLMDQNIRTSDNVTFNGITITGNSTLGNSEDDTHTFTGNITASGEITASKFLGDGSGLTNITSTNIITNVTAVTASIATGSLDITGSVNYTSHSVSIPKGIGVSGSILPSVGSGIVSTFDLGSPTEYWKNSFVSQSVANEFVGKLIGTATGIEGGGNISAGNITASGDISSSNFSILESTASFSSNNILLESDNPRLIFRDNNGTGFGDFFIDRTGFSVVFSFDGNANNIFKFSTNADTNNLIIDGTHGNVIIGKAQSQDAGILGGNPVKLQVEGGNISGSHDLSIKRNITGSGNLSIEGNTVLGNVTASGNISASGTVFANQIEVDQLVSRIADDNTGIQIDSDQVIIQGNDVILAKFNTNEILLNKPISSNITASGNISASGTTNVIGGTTQFLVSSSLTGSNEIGIKVDNAASGDSIISFKNTHDEWIVGLDNGDNDSFKIAGGAGVTGKGLGQNTRFKIDSAGHSSFLGNISASGIISGSDTGSFAALAVGNTTGQYLITTTGISHKNVVGQIDSIFRFDGTRFVIGDPGAAMTISGSSLKLCSEGDTTFDIEGNDFTIQKNENVFYRINFSDVDPKLEVTGNFEIDPTGFSTKIDSNITASGDISSSGTITAEHLTISDDASISDVLTVGSLNASTSITASSNISSSAYVKAAIYQIKDKQLAAADTSKIMFGTTLSKSEIEGTNIKLDAPVTASGDISASGTIFAGGANIIGNTTASGNISASGTIKGLTGSFGLVTGLSPITFASEGTFTNDINFGAHPTGGDMKLLVADDTNLVDPIVQGSVTVGIPGSGRTSFGGNREVEIHSRAALKLYNTSGSGHENTIGSYILLGSGSIKGVKVENEDLYNIRFGSGSLTGAQFNTAGTLRNNYYAGTDTFIINTAKGNVTASGEITASLFRGNKAIIDFLQIDSTSIASTTDEDVFMALGSNGIAFEATANDKFRFNTNNNNVDFKIDGADSPNVFYVDASTNQVGILTDSPSSSLTIKGDLEVKLPGNITASGDVTASGNIIGNIGRFSSVNIDGVTALDTSNSATTGQIFSDSSIVKLNIGKESVTTSITTEGNITASGNISASGNITASGNIGAGFSEGGGFQIGTFNALSADSSGPTLYLGNNTSWVKIVYGRDANDLHDFKGNITASGNITANNFTGSSSGINTGDQNIANLAVTGSSVIFTNITASAMSSSGNLTAGGDVILGDSCNDSITLNGTVTASCDISSSGTIMTSGTGSFGAVNIVNAISASNFSGNSSGTNTGDQNISNLAITGSNVVFGNITASVVSASSIIASNLSGTNTGDQDLSNLAITGSNVIFGNITASGNISASGNITNTGNISSTDITASGAISASGTIIASNFSGNSSGTNTGDQNLANLAITGSNVVFGNITASAISSSGDLTIGGDIILGDSCNDSITLNGTVTASCDISSSGNLDLTGNANIDGNLDVDGTTNLDAVDIDGAVQVDNTFTVGVDDTGYDVKFFGATSGQFLLWDESADELALVGDTKLSFHDAAGGENIVASSDGHLEINAGTTLDITAPTVDINASTEVNIDGNVDLNGTLDVSSHITASGNISASGTVFANEVQIGSSTVNINGPAGNITASGDISASGTTSTNEAIITGNATSSGNISASGNLIANKLILDDGSSASPSFTFGSDLNTGIYRSGNDRIAFQVGGGNVEMVLNGDGEKLMLSQVHLQVGDATSERHITASGNISASGTIISTAGFTGTLLTAAQTNITSVGTLTGLNVSSHITSSGNIKAAGDIIATGSGSFAHVVGRSFATASSNAQVQNITMTEANYPGGSVIGLDMDSNTNDVQFTLPALTPGLRYTFLVNSNAGTGATLKITSPSAGNLAGVAICDDGNEDILGTTFTIAAAKAFKGTRLEIVSDGVIHHLTAFCLCDVADVSTA